MALALRPMAHGGLHVPPAAARRAPGRVWAKTFRRAAEDCSTSCNRAERRNVDEQPSPIEQQLAQHRVERHPRLARQHAAPQAGWVRLGSFTRPTWQISVIKLDNRAAVLMLVCDGLCGQQSTPRAGTRS